MENNKKNLYHAVTISCFERLRKMHLIRLKKVKIFGLVDYVVSFTLCIGIEISKGTSLRNDLLLQYVNLYTIDFYF